MVVLILEAPFIWETFGAIMGDSKLNSAPSLQATHSHLSSCLRSLSGASSSAEAAAQAMDQGARDNSGWDLSLLRFGASLNFLCVCDTILA
jgi:hypothetical protein